MADLVREGVVVRVAYMDACWFHCLLCVDEPESTKSDMSHLQKTPVSGWIYSATKARDPKQSHC
jgi:hypothetical protein